MLAARIPENIMDILKPTKSCCTVRNRHSIEHGNKHEVIKFELVTPTTALSEQSFIFKQSREEKLWVLKSIKLTQFEETDHYFAFD